MNFGVGRTSSTHNRKYRWFFTLFFLSQQYYIDFKNYFGNLKRCIKKQKFKMFYVFINFQWKIFSSWIDIQLPPELVQQVVTPLCQHIFIMCVLFCFVCWLKSSGLHTFTKLLLIYLVLWLVSFNRSSFKSGTSKLCIIFLTSVLNWWSHTNYASFPVIQRRWVGVVSDDFSSRMWR